MNYVICKERLSNSTLRTTNIQIGNVKASHSKGEGTNKFSIGLTLRPGLDVNTGVINKTKIAGAQLIDIENIEGGEN